MKRTLEAIGFPIRDFAMIIDRDCTIVTISSSCPESLEAAQEAVTKFGLETEPDGLDVKGVTMYDPLGRVMDEALVWRAAWKHGDASEPPQIIESSRDTSTCPNLTS